LKPPNKYQTTKLTFKMHFTKAFLALALVAAPIFAAPAAVAEDDHLESRAVSALL
jgi:hypothetical protein